MPTDLLKTKREEKGYTQEGIAQKIETTLRNYQLIEAGRTEPRIKLALKLCKILNINPYKVWYDNNQEN